MKLSTIHAPRETPITIEIDEILDRRAQAVPGGVTSFDRPAEPQAVFNARLTGPERLCLEPVSVRAGWPCHATESATSMPSRARAGFHTLT